MLRNNEYQSCHTIATVTVVEGICINASALVRAFFIYIWQVLRTDNDPCLRRRCRIDGQFEINRTVTVYRSMIIFAGVREMHAVEVIVLALTDRYALMLRKLTCPVNNNLIDTIATVNGV